MRIQALVGPLALLAVAACSTAPGQNAPMTTGVGFGDYQRYLQSRSAPSRQSSTPYSVPPQTRSAPILPPSSMPANAPTTVDAVPVRTLPQAQPRAAAPAPTAQPSQSITTHPLAAPIQPVAAQPAAQYVTSTPAPAPSAAPVQSASTGTARVVQAGAGFGTTPSFDAGPSVRPGISDEQDFNAVSSRETIESDRQRIQRQRAQYQVIEVASVPDASVSGGPNLVQYALSTSHAPGTRVHRRLNPLRWSRWENACLQFRNQDAAQEAFLSRGGPNRDPDHLDPDGDGFACWWDPTPMRRALASN